MRADQFACRLSQTLERQIAEPMRWWYLSFADDRRGGFLGAVIIEGRGFLDAVRIQHLGPIARWPA